MKPYFESYPPLVSDPGFLDLRCCPFRPTLFSSINTCSVQTQRFRFLRRAAGSELTLLHPFKIHVPHFLSPFLLRLAPPPPLGKGFLSRASLPALPALSTFFRPPNKPPVQSLAVFFCRTSPSRRALLLSSLIISHPESLRVFFL